MRYVTREVFLSDFRAVDAVLGECLGAGWRLIASGAYMEPETDRLPARVVVTYTFDTHALDGQTEEKR